MGGACVPEGPNLADCGEGRAAGVPRERRFFLIGQSLPLEKGRRHDLDVRRVGVRARRIGEEPSIFDLIVQPRGVREPLGRVTGLLACVVREPFEGAARRRLRQVGPRTLLNLVVLSPLGPRKRLGSDARHQERRGEERERAARRKRDAPRSGRCTRKKDSYP